MALKDTIHQLHGIHAPRGTGELDLVDPYFRPRHMAWLADIQPWSPAALEHARKYLAGEYQQERKGRVSPSSMGDDCERALLFSFGAAPQVPAPEDSEAVMQSGTMDHLVWQMEGLTAGWLVDVEIWNHNEELRCGGSQDGEGDDHSLFELKNCAPHLYVPISKGWDYLMKERAKTEKTGMGSSANYAAAMVRKHVIQAETYTVLDKLRAQPRLNGLISLVYQCRSSKQVTEIRFRSDEGRRRQVMAILESLHEWIDLNELPDMLEGCHAAVTPGLSPTAKQKTVFDRCFYREHCPTAKAVT